MPKTSPDKSRSVAIDGTELKENCRNTLFCKISKSPHIKVTGALLIIWVYDVIYLFTNIIHIFYICLAPRKLTKKRKGTGLYLYDANI